MITAFPHRTRNLPILAQVSVVALLLTNLALARSHDELCVDLLPAEAQGSLHDEFPDLYPQRVSDLSAEYQQAWLKEHPQECPGIAVGHFQSPSKTSYAVLLVGRRGALSGSKLVVMSQSGGGAWKVTKLVEETVAYHYEAVSKVSSGKSKRAAGAAAKPSLDRIQFKEFDGGATVYYWSGGRFRQGTRKE